LLHTGSNITETISDAGSKEEAKMEKLPTAVVAQASSQGVESHVMLSTAILDVVNGNGYLTPCRALLDCGAQANFISTDCMNTLGLKPFQRKLSIRGISNAVVECS